MATGDELTEPGTSVVLTSIVSMNFTPVAGSGPPLEIVTVYMIVSPGVAVPPGTDAVFVAVIAGANTAAADAAVRARATPTAGAGWAEAGAALASAAVIGVDFVGNPDRTKKKKIKMLRMSEIGLRKYEAEANRFMSRSLEIGRASW